MAFRAFTFLHARAAGVALCGALAVAVGIGVAGSERLVQSGFDKALARRAPATAAQPVSPLAQSEEFWLHNGHGRRADVKPVAWSGELSRGDRLTVSGGNGERVLEVIDTGRISLDATRLDAGPASAQFIAVTCREVGRPDAALVRLIITDGGALPFPVTRAGEKAVL
jgi:hypothetical protein